MAEVKIKQSGRRGGGIVLAGIMLAVLYFAKNGPQIGDIHDRYDRQQVEQQRVEHILEHTGDDIKKLRQVFEEGDSIQKSLENLPKGTPKGSVDSPREP